MNPSQDRPYYGAGFEFPHEFDQDPDLSLALEDAEIVEIIPEGFFHGKRSELLKRLGDSGVPVLVHSVELSLGTDEPLRPRHLDNIMRVMDQVNSVFLSDHVCMTRAGGVDIGQLTTLAYTPHNLDILCRNIDLLRDYVGDIPMMFENITHRFQVPHNTLHEADFLNKMAKRTGCGILLDVTNLYINSVNFKFDPIAYLDRLESPLIHGIHLAGGEWEEGKLYDTHSRETHPEVWELLRKVLGRADPQAIIVEWDQDPPGVAALKREVQIAQSLRSEVRLPLNSFPMTEVSLCL